MLQRPGQDEAPQWLALLMKWGILAFVFVAPIVKGLIETLKQRRSAAQKAREQGTSAEPAPSGRAAWDELVRGRSAPPAQRVPPPAPARAEEADEDQPLAEPTPPPFVDLPSRSIPPLPPGVQDEEDEVEEEVAERERAEFQRQEQVAAAEYAASSPYRKKVEPLPASALAPVPAPAAARPSTAERWLYPKAPARSPREALARAIVLRELLGPPVALRRIEEPWSATG